MNVIPPKKEGRIKRPGDDAQGQPDKESEIARAMAELRSCVRELEEAMRAEGIDPLAPLGVWCRALQSSIGALATFVDVSTERVDGKSEIVERAMNAQVERVKVTIEEMRAASAYFRSRVSESEEARKVENLDLAKQLGDGIQESLKTTMVAREIRFNRRQNWSAVALVASVLLACFIAGGLWTSYRSDQGVVGRCLSKLVPDQTGHQFYCSMDIVRGRL